MLQTADFIKLIPELILAIGAMVLLMVGAFGGKTKLVLGLTLAMLLAVLIVLCLGHPFAQVPSEVLAFGGLVQIDGFGWFVKILTLIGTGLVLLMGWNWLEREALGKYEVLVVATLALLGMFIMIDANSLMTLYIGLELQSLSLYILAAFNRDQRQSSEAGLKYFLLGALSSGLLLYGISMIYGTVGGLSFGEITKFSHEFIATTQTGETAAMPLGLLVGLILVICGLAFKISAVPFHMWTPDVYEGSPAPITALFAVAPKLAAMVPLVRLLVGPFGEWHQQWQQIIMVLAVASMVLGAFAAINQTSIKRLLAYSSIANMGYSLIGLAVGNVAGISSLLIYLTIYMVMTVGAFGCILSLRRNGKPLDQMSDLAGLAKFHPKTAFALTIFMFSMTGIPPLAGFFGKFYVFLAAIQAGYYPLAIIGVLTSVVAAYYYLRIVKLVYFDEAKSAMEPVNHTLGWVTAATASLVVLFFLVPNPLIQLANLVTMPLFGGK